MESLVGINVGANDRYLLQALVEQSGFRFIYEALDREEDCPRRVEIWNLELTTDQDEFLSQLSSIAQVTDRRLLRVIDGGILVVPIGSDILKELPYVVTAPGNGTLITPDLTVEQVLSIGIKVAAILHRLHSGTHIRARSGQIIGQIKLCHGHLSLDTIHIDPQTAKVTLSDWYRFSLLEKHFVPDQDIKDLIAILQAMLPHPPRSVAEIWQREYSSAKALGEDLRTCQLKLKQSWFPQKLALLGILALPILGLIFFLPKRPTVTEITSPVLPPPRTSPPRPITTTKFIPKPEPPREQQVYRIDLPTAPKVTPAPPPSLPPIPRSTRPTPPVVVRPRPRPQLPLTNPTPVVIAPPASPLVPPSRDTEPFKAIETTIDGNFANSYNNLVQQAGRRALVTIAGEFSNPNREEVSMLVLATKQGKTAPIFSARVTRSEWQSDPTGTTWANYMSRSNALLGFNAPPNPNSFQIAVPPRPTNPIVPAIQPLKPAPTTTTAPKNPTPSTPQAAPTPAEIDEQINDRK